MMDAGDISQATKKTLLHKCSSINNSFGPVSCKDLRFVNIRKNPFRQEDFREPKKKNSEFFLPRTADARSQAFPADDYFDYLYN